VSMYFGAWTGRPTCRPPQDPGSPLSMSRAEMRRTGFAVVDLLVDWGLQPDPVIQQASPDQMATLLHTSTPETPLGVDEVLLRQVRDVFPRASKVGHPSYFAYIPGSTTWPAALAEFMGTVSNVYCGSLMEAAGPSQLELTVLDWFRSWLGMPEGTDGILDSGGSAANLMAFAAARDLRFGPDEPGRGDLLRRPGPLVGGSRGARPGLSAFRVPVRVRDRLAFDINEDRRPRQTSNNDSDKADQPLADESLPLTAIPPAPLARIARQVHDDFISGWGRRR
jgi:Pyridoxal-dependent decarboxylase conserved domain